MNVVRMSDGNRPLGTVTLKLEESACYEPHHTHNEMEKDHDTPKDLSVKTKKLKQIPPPLNLMTRPPDPIPQPSPLKDFAILATSPKSPLMQKNLPFRKRAYSFSGVYDKVNKPALPPPGPTPTTSNTTLPHEVLASPSCLPPSTQSSPGPLPPPSPSPSIKEEKPILQPPDPVRPHPVQHLAMFDSSALLSPAPSSLGSSQEELNYSPNWSSMSWALPWPLPVWHCFLPGSRIRVEQLMGGCWQLAEDLSSCAAAWSPEWLGPLQVDLLQLIRGEELEGSPMRVSLQFSYMPMPPVRLARPWEGGVTAECEPHHPFLVQDKGWCAVYPDLVLKQYGVTCRPLERGDICVTPSQLSITSPDICERFKRFSFPPEDVTSMASSTMPAPAPSPQAPPTPEGLLSPPTSPTKKVLDSMRPKRPMNAFMLFAKKYRLDLIQRYPGKDNRAISVLLGEAWRSLPLTERDVYVQEARIMAQEQKRLHPDCWKRKRSHSTS